MKNTLVQYSGGGYDGCIWEWNYFFVDGVGKFHDIFSSGCSGCDTQEKADALMADESKTKYTYDLTDEKAIIEFINECNPVNITGVLQWFCDNETDVDFFVVCSVCGEHIDDGNDLSLQDWRGCGGIMSTADMLICYECLALGTCGCCDEYVEADQLIGYNEEDGSICENCAEYQAEQIKEEEQQDLLFMSWTTGIPDMFSEDMQWFWG